MLDAIILGFIQGASEFLPISSSAHLVFGQALLNVNEPSIFLEIALHLGTLLAVLIYYRRDLAVLVKGFVSYLTSADKQPHRASFLMCLFIIVGTIPAGVGGLLFKDWFEARFDSATFSGYMLLITGCVLLLTRLIKVRQRALNFGNALAIGVAQFCAILPGISRSGSTISAGLFFGVEPREAARFSFLLSVPAVAGAVLLKFKDLLETNQIPSHDLAKFGVGATVSFAAGLITIHWLLKLISGRKFFLFGFYCLAVGVFAILYF